MLCNFHIALGLQQGNEILIALLAVHSNGVPIGIAAVGHGDFGVFIQKGNGAVICALAAAQIHAGGGDSGKLCAAGTGW